MNWNLLGYDVLKIIMEYCPYVIENEKEYLKPYLLKNNLWIDCKYTKYIFKDYKNVFDKFYEYTNQITFENLDDKLDEYISHLNKMKYSLIHLNK